MFFLLLYFARHNSSTSNIRLYILKHKSFIIKPARVAKLADAPDLGSGGEILRGSSPLPGTANSPQTLNAQRPTLNVQFRRAPVEHWVLDVRRSTFGSASFVSRASKRASIKKICRGIQAVVDLSCFFQGPSLTKFKL